MLRSVLLETIIDIDLKFQQVKWTKGANVLECKKLRNRIQLIFHHILAELPTTKEDTKGSRTRSLSTRQLSTFYEPSGRKESWQVT